MSKSFKLDDIKAAAERQYANTEIEMGEGESPVLLRNVLQLSEEERKSLTEERPEGDKETQLEHFHRLIRVIADSAEGADRLISEFGENLAYYAQCIEFYNSESEAGEA